VAPVNDRPVAVGDAISVAEDTPFTSVVQLDANDTDIDGDVLSVVAGTFITNAGGSITIAADGSYTYTPPLNFNGTDFFDYTVSDGILTDIGRLNITVTPVNDRPVAVDDAISVPEDSPFTSAVQLDANDADVDGDALTVVAGTFATNAGGSITLAADGSYTYTPPLNFNGPDFVDYTVTDGVLTDVGRLNITVAPVNDRPVAVDDAISIVEDTPFTSAVQLDANDTDVDGDTLTVVPGTFTTNAGGSITFAADGSYTYTPPANYNGPDFVDYIVTDGTLTDIGRLTITVTPVNDPPVNAVPGAQMAIEDTPLAITGVSVADIDSPALTTTLTVINGIVAVAVSGATITGNGTATVTIAGSAAQINAALAGLTYSSTADYNGPAQLSVSTTDGAQTDSDTVAITVTPVADITSDTVTTAEDTPASFNVITGTNGATADSFENAGRVVTSVTQPPAGQGNVTFLPAGSLIYTPPPNFSGTTSFTYTVTSGGVTETATVNVTVVPGNDPPVAVNDSASTPEDTPLTVSPVAGLLVNDTDPDPADGKRVTQFTVSATTVTVPPGAIGGSTTIAGVGTLTVRADGSYDFVPAANFNGPVPPITYTMADTAGANATATLAIAVTPVNDPPVAVADTVTATEDAPVTVNLIGNDSDGEGDTLTVKSINGIPLTPGVAQVIPVPNGTVSVSAAGIITFIPDPNFNGPVTFPYVVQDGKGGEAPAPVRISVAPVNDPPTAVDDTAISEPNIAATGNVLGNDADIDGDPIRVAQFTVTGVPGIFVAGSTVNIPGVGTLSINADGRYAFTPVADYSGAVPAATYTVSDGKGRTATATLRFADIAAVTPPLMSPNVLIEDTPRIPSLEMQIDPALHVLLSVNDSRVEMALGSSQGLFQTDSATLAELFHGLGQDLSFAAGNVRGSVNLIPLDRGLIRAVQTNPPTALYVQSAVRHQPLTADDSLYVQHSVRASQLEARFRDVRLVSLNAAVPGVTTLLDPFALGVPGVRAEPGAVGEVESTPLPEENASRIVTGQSEHEPSAFPETAQPENTEVVSKPIRQAAVGFGDQMQIAAAQMRPLAARNGMSRRGP
jgi:CshA-type fibril repeat protein